MSDPEWSTTTPTLNTLVTEVPTEETENRQYLEDALDREHTFPGTYGSTSGKHMPGRCSVLFCGTLAQIEALSSPPQYAEAYATDTQLFYYYSGSAWVATDLVTLSTEQTISGNKTFSGDNTFSGSVTFSEHITLPSTDPVEDTDAVHKGYVDGQTTAPKIKVSSNDTTADYLVNKLVASDSSTLTETDDGGEETLTIGLVEATAGDYVEGSDSTGGSTTNTSYTQIGDTFYIPRAGTYRVNFDIKSSDGNTVYGKVYRDDEAVGTERSTDEVDYVTKTEDISGWSAGEILSIYIKGSNGCTVYLDNIEVCTGNPLVAMEEV